MKPEQKRYPQQDKMKEQLSIKLLSGIKLIIHPDYKIGLDLLNEWINDAEELEHQNKELRELLLRAKANMDMEVYYDKDWIDDYNKLLKQ